MDVILARLIDFFPTSLIFRQANYYFIIIYFTFLAVILIFSYNLFPTSFLFFYFLLLLFVYLFRPLLCILSIIISLFLLFFMLIYLKPFVLFLLHFNDDAEKIQDFLMDLQDYADENGEKDSLWNFYLFSFTLQETHSYKYLNLLGLYIFHNSCLKISCVFWLMLCKVLNPDYLYQLTLYLLFTLLNILNFSNVPSLLFFP